MSRRRYDAATAEAPSSGIALEPLRNCTELPLRQIARGLAPSSGDGTVGLLSDPGAATEPLPLGHHNAIRPQSRFTETCANGEFFCTYAFPAPCPEGTRITRIS